MYVLVDNTIYICHTMTSQQFWFKSIPLAKKVFPKNYNHFLVLYLQVFHWCFSLFLYFLYTYKSEFFWSHSDSSSLKTWILHHVQSQPPSFSLHKFPLLPNHQSSLCLHNELDFYYVFNYRRWVHLWVSAELKSLQT